eukprot:1142355-Pelagomonas_calceolata.AAC.5
MTAQAERNNELALLRAEEEERLATVLARRQHEVERSQREVQQLREQSEELRASYNMLFQNEGIHGNLWWMRQDSYAAVCVAQRVRGCQNCSVDPKLRNCCFLKQSPTEVG